MSRLLTHEKVKLLNSVKTIFFDCDGVLWDSNGPIKGSLEAVQRLRSLQKQLIFVTNNSTLSRKQYALKFAKYGFDVQQNEILSSAYAAVVYLKDVLKVEHVFCIGSEGLKSELDEVGLKHCSIDVQDYVDYDHKVFSSRFSADPNVKAVLVAYNKNFGIPHIAAAMRYLKDPSIPYVVTNTDNKYPIGDGSFGPGTGCIVNAVSTACERQPVVAGKPNRLMYEIARKRFDIDSSTTLMIGDRLDTDILFGTECGFQRLCVLSGVTSEDEIKCEQDEKLIPHYYTERLSDLLE